MKGVATLIRLHKLKLDELRRTMTSLESQKHQLLQLSAKLSNELRRELELASSQPDMSRFFGDFASRIRTRQENIAQEVKKLDAQMENLRIEISDAFGEVKKYELLKEQWQKAKKEKEAKRESAQFDEIALQRFARHDDTHTG